MLMVSGELGFNVHLQRYRNVVLEQTKHPAVALNLRYHYRKGDRCISVVRHAAERGDIVVEDHPGASPVDSVAAGYNHGDDLLRGQERNQLTEKLVSFDRAFVTGLYRRLIAFERKRFQLLEVLIAVALKEGLLGNRNIAHRAEQNNLARQFPLVFSHVAALINHDGDRLRG